MQPAKKLSPVIIALIVIVLLGVGTAAVVVANQSKKDSTGSAVQAEESSVSNEPQTSSSSEDSSVTYKNGTYTETGKYISPGGAESIKVSVTLENDIITSATVTGGATGESKEYQDYFISGYKSSVVGKDVDTVSLSRVGGSSLTSSGFNAALKLIKADAKA
jgi:hypothetical protein